VAYFFGAMHPVYSGAESKGTWARPPLLQMTWHGGHRE